MKIYKTTATIADGNMSVRWAGSQSDAAGQRKQYTAGGIKRADITTEEVDVPTNKAGLLEWLNSSGFA